MRCAAAAAVAHHLHAQAPTMHGCSSIIGKAYVPLLLLPPVPLLLLCIDRYPAAARQTRRLSTNSLKGTRTKR
jgi:hypothetical protein